MAVAMEWVAQITGYAFELALPVGIGYWLDRKWGTAPWLVVAGVVVGVVISTFHLMQMIAALSGQQRPRKKNGTE